MKIKCIKCHTKLKKKETQCSVCKHQMTNDEIIQQTLNAKRKRKRSRLIIWGSLIFLIVLIVYLSNTCAFFIDMELKGNKIEYGQPLYFDAFFECSDLSYGARPYTIDVYVDGNYLKNFDGKIERGENSSFEYSILHDFSYESGMHTLVVEDFNYSSTIEFEVLSEADVYLDFDPYTQIPLVGKTISLDYFFINKGDSGINFTHDFIFEDIKETKEDYIAPEQRVYYSFDIFSEQPGNKTISIDDHEFDVYFFETARPENGYKIMANQVKGYSYFDIQNTLDYDVVVSILPYQEDSNSCKAVASRYIQKGESHRINSIVHGEYFIVIQKGQDWVDALSRFATDETIYWGKYYYDLNNDVKSGYGSYQYIEYKINENDLLFDFNKYDERPLFPSDMEYDLPDTNNDNSITT